MLGKPVVTLEARLMVRACDVGLYSTTWLDTCRMGCHAESETGTRATDEEDGSHVHKLNTAGKCIEAKFVPSSSRSALKKVNATRTGWKCAVSVTLARD